MDYCLFQKINNLAGQWPLLDNMGRFFAEYLPYALAFLVLLFFWRRWKIILQALLAAIVAKFVIIDFIHLFWYRQRPFAEQEISSLIGEIGQASFPSVHTALFFALSTVVYSYNKRAGFGFFIASFLMGVSRVFVGVHWPLDILAGILVGIFSGWLVLKISQRISR